MRPFSKKDIYLTVFYLLWILILFDSLFHQLVRGYAKESWGITEWLINYQGGFVRRGLPGEFIFKLYNYIGLSPYYTIIISCIVAYAILLVFFVKSFLKKGYPIFMISFVFFLGGPIISGLFLRKDVLIILIFILSIYLSLKKSNIYLILMNLILIAGLLIHEAIGFFAFPILLLIFCRKNNDELKISGTSTKSIARSILQLSPSIFIFFLCLYNKGSLTISNMIWNSWKPIDFPIQTGNNFGIPAFINEYQIPAAINGLSWSLKQGLSLTVNTLKNFNDGIYAPIAWFIILLMIYFVLTNLGKTNIKSYNNVTTSDLTKTNISNILIFQFLFIIPLFILGWDYGRWVFFWVTSSFSIILLIPGEELSLLFPKFIMKTGLVINYNLDSIFGKSQEIIFLIVILIGVPASGWTLSSYLNTTPLIIILHFISNLFHHLLLFIKTWIF
jgi:hypothetical protein